MAKVNKERAEAAYLKASTHLANANEAAERGNKAKADRLYDKAQYWLDRANAAAGNS
jgi:hypothetical protein